VPLKRKHANDEKNKIEQSTPALKKARKGNKNLDKNLNMKLDRSEENLKNVSDSAKNLKKKKCKLNSKNGEEKNSENRKKNCKKESDIEPTASAFLKARKGKINIVVPEKNIESVEVHAERPRKVGKKQRKLESEGKIKKNSEKKEFTIVETETGLTTTEGIYRRC